MLADDLRTGSRMRGRYPGRVEPPPAPPPIEWRPARAGSAGMGIEEVVRELVVTFKVETGGRGFSRLRERLDGPWRHVVRLLATDLLDEGISPAGFVACVAAGVRRLRGRDPWPAEVFSPRALPVWLGAYRRDAASWIPGEGYVATEERRRQVRAHWANCLG